MIAAQVQISLHGDLDGVAVDTVAAHDRHQWTALHLDENVRLSLHAPPAEVVALLRRLADDVEARAGLVTA